MQRKIIISVPKVLDEAFKCFGVSFISINRFTTDFFVVWLISSTWHIKVFQLSVFLLFFLTFYYHCHVQHVMPRTLKKQHIFSIVVNLAAEVESK